MFPAVRFQIEHDPSEPGNEPDAMILRFFNQSGDELSIRLTGYITYRSERGAPFDETVSLAEDFLGELASMLGYTVSE